MRRVELQPLKAPSLVGASRKTTRLGLFLWLRSKSMLRREKVLSGSEIPWTRRLARVCSIQSPSGHMTAVDVAGTISLAHFFTMAH